MSPPNHPSSSPGADDAPAPMSPSTGEPAERATGLHDLFRAQAARTPSAPALAQEERIWTYAQLDALTDQFAHVLTALGVGPEVVVAGYLQSPAERVIHVLAVLKAGGAYLALDQHLTGERLWYLLTDAEAAIVIHDCLPPTLVSAGVDRTVSVQRLRTDAARAPAAPVPNGVHPCNAAYVTYADGPAGRPTKIVVKQGDAVAHAEVFAELFERFAGLNEAASMRHS
jgi:non-ribosomal peptide synthetase component F